MDNSKFSILEAVKNAYLFVGREWLYLVKLSTLPVIVQAGTSVFILFQRPDASAIEAYLWGIPASLLFAWFMFLETRLLLLNERLDQLPQDRSYLNDRQISMKISVITMLLFNMGLSAATSLLLLTTGSGNNILFTLAGLVLSGIIIWGLRCGVLPILTAVGYPIPPFLQRVQGMMFSLRLLGMALVSLLPLAFMLQFLIALFFNKPVDMSAPFKLTDIEQMAIAVASAPLSLLLSALLNAAAAYALKQILGSRQNGVLA